MRKTGPIPVIALVVVGAVAGYLLQTGLAVWSMTRIRPEYTLSFSVALIAVVVVLLALPIWRATRGRSPRRVDPFRATRTVLLAKAAAYLGAALTGVAGGFVLDVVLRPAAASPDPLWRCLAMLGASILLLVAGLVAEQLCTVPPGDGDAEGPDGVEGTG